MLELTAAPAAIPKSEPRTPVKDEPKTATTKFDIDDEISF
jgi:hypothetical protein